MIDVHILVVEKESPMFLVKCLCSLLPEKDINIQLFPNAKESISDARSNAFMKGNSEYVSFVDGDDEITSGAFVPLVDALENDKDAVAAYCDEILVDAEGKFLKYGWSINPKPFLDAGHRIDVCKINDKYIHHLIVMRRDAVEKCLPLKVKNLCEPELFHKLNRLGKILHIPYIGYKWRIHGGNMVSRFTDKDFDDFYKEINGNP